jgi:tRNA (guanine-N7-)-methyltransferase
MRLRNVSGSEELIAKSKYVCMRPESYRGKWNSFFQNENPIHIEIGMGKGKFIIDMASLCPNINYIGIEKYSSVIWRAVQKVERAERNNRSGQGILSNLALVRMDAGDILKVFRAGEVAKIYLNFSDPWPKDRHAKRRLPSREFLRLFDIILHVSGNLEFKTDNEKLFRFAEEELGPAGWKADAVTYDLHHNREMMQGNVMTEYEEKFSSAGHPIYKYIISR